MRFSFNVDASALTSYAQQFGSAISQPMANPTLKGGMEESASVYLGAMRQRFSGASHGDGTWVDLAPATKLARLRAAGMRYPRTKGTSRADRLRSVASIPLPILYITGGIYTSIVPNETDNVFEDTQNGVTAGTRNHVANYHQQGGGRLPQRQILIPPDEETQAVMRDPVAAAVAETSNAIIAQVAASVLS